MGFVNVEKISSTKQNETQRKRCSEHDNPTKDPHKLYFYLENFMPHL